MASFTYWMHVALVMGAMLGTWLGLRLTFGILCVFSPYRNLANVLTWLSCAGIFAWMGWRIFTGAYIVEAFVPGQDYRDGSMLVSGMTLNKSLNSILPIVVFLGAVLSLLKAFSNPGYRERLAQLGPVVLARKRYNGPGTPVFPYQLIFWGCLISLYTTYTQWQAHALEPLKAGIGPAMIAYGYYQWKIGTLYLHEHGVRYFDYILLYSELETLACDGGIIIAGGGSMRGNFCDMNFKPADWRLGLGFRFSVTSLDSGDAELDRQLSKIQALITARQSAVTSSPDALNTPNTPEKPDG